MRKKSLWIVIAWLGLATTACLVGGIPGGVPTSTPTLEVTLLATNTPLGAQDPTIPTLVPTLASGGLVSDATLPSDDCQSTYHSRLPAGSTFQIVAGPSCDSGLIFWQVNFNGQVGWTAEADATTFYVEPIGAASSAIASTDCPGSPAARLSVGSTAKVMPGDPNILRNDAGVSATVLARLPAGSVFAVIGGPRCADNLRWWQVNYNGQMGWTVEGQGGTYWLEPAPND